MAKDKGNVKVPPAQFDEPVMPTQVEEVSLESLTKEQLIGVIESLSVEIEELKNGKQTFLVNPISYNEDEMKVFYETEDFKEGEKLALKLAGMYSVLENFGMSLETAMDICVNQHTYDNSVRIVKEQSIKAENESL